MNGLVRIVITSIMGKFCSECGTPKVTEENKIVQVVQENTKDKGENKEGVTI